MVSLTMRICGCENPVTTHIATEARNGNSEASILQLSNSALVHRLAVRRGEHTLLRPILSFQSRRRRFVRPSLTTTSTLTLTMMRFSDPHLLATTHIQQLPGPSESNDAQSAPARFLQTQRDSSAPLFGVSLVYPCSQRVITTIENNTTHHSFASPPHRQPRPLSPLSPYKARRILFTF